MYSAYTSPLVRAEICIRIHHGDFNEEGGLAGCNCNVLTNITAFSRLLLVGLSTRVDGLEPLRVKGVWWLCQSCLRGWDD